MLQLGYWQVTGWHVIMGLPVCYCGVTACNCWVTGMLLSVMILCDYWHVTVGLPACNCVVTSILLCHVIVTVG